MISVKTRLVELDFLQVGLDLTCAGPDGCGARVDFAQQDLHVAHHEKLERALMHQHNIHGGRPGDLAHHLS